MEKELLEFEIGSYKWALVKALQGHLVTCSFLWESKGEGYIEWDGETTFMAYLNFSNDVICLDQLDYVVDTEFNKDDWRICEYEEIN